MNTHTEIKTANLEIFLGYAAALVRTYGYIKSQDAKATGKESTGQLAWIWAQNGRSHALLRDVQLTQEDRWLAEDTAKWMREIAANPLMGKSGSNDYLVTLAKIGHMGKVTEREIGFAASAPQAFQRDKGKATQPAKGNFLGKEGEKIHDNFIFVECVTIDSKFGVCFKYTFKDTQENKLTWLTGKNPSELNVTAGNIYYVSGRVKKHSTYGGQNTTEITRATVRK